MKHYYFQSRLWQRFRLLCIILTSMTLMHSCADGSSDFQADNTKENLTSLKEDSILRFSTIDELDNLTVSDIPGDYSGYTMTGLTYECVDTIELRALRYNVTATLQSPDKQTTDIYLTADVGPELVSVEYYPSIMTILAHDNMEHNYYGLVERYRNYSDGSRIGPDEFYDYGHPLEIRIGGSRAAYPNFYGIMEYNRKEIDGIHYEEDETFYHCFNDEYKLNLNTKLINENGKVYSGEDFYPLQVASWRMFETETEHEHLYYDIFPSYLDNYYIWPDFNTPWLQSRPINTDIPENYELANLGRNVPDNSPTPWPEDTKSLQPGWYSVGSWDHHDYTKWLLQKFSYWDGWMIGGFELGVHVYFSLSYLVIDGRIIHLNDYMKGYEGIRNIEPEVTITKVEDGYKIRAEAYAHLYGEKFGGVYNMHIIGVNGPINEIDLSSYDELANKDSDELNNLSTRGSNTENEMPKLTPRKDGKTMEIDRRLPNSINNLNTRNSIIKN